MTYNQDKITPAEIAKIPFFYDLTVENQLILSRYITLRYLDELRYVFKEGDKPTGIYFLLEGKVKIVKKNPDNTEELLDELTSPQFFSEMSLIDGRRKSASVVTLTKTKLAVLTCDNFERLEQDAPDIAIDIIRKVAHTIGIKLRKASNNREGII